MKSSLTANLIWASVALLIGSTFAVAGETSDQTPAEQIVWGETPFGPLASPVSGDFSTGQHITFIKFPAGMKTPVHTHTHDYVGIVISGVTRHFEPGKPETEVDLPAGSHWSIPAGLPHISECLPGVECVMAIYQDENFDFHPTN
jgi:uncharacterized RmlC-like cupin family protein